MTNDTMREAASSTSGMAHMGNTTRCAELSAVPSTVAMMHDAMPHTTTQYWRCTNQLSTFVESSDALSPEPTPAICRSS